MSVGTYQQGGSVTKGQLPPLVGLGTFRAGPLLKAGIKHALLCGITHIDTASIYKNEEEIGEAVREAIQEGIVTRRDVFITSKVSPYEHGTQAAYAACEAILQRLGLGYVDLLLIHWPGVARTDGNSPLNAEKRKETWRVLEDFYTNGKVRGIGVSNYEIPHLEELLTYARIPPFVNQFECHPAWPQPELRAYCRENNISCIAYASFGTGALFDAREVNVVASRSGKTLAQVLLLWGLQKNCAVLPKSTRPERISEYAPTSPGMLPDGDGRYLCAEDEALLDSIGSKRPQKYCWNPTSIT